jgi:hypothetical protein
MAYYLPQYLSTNGNDNNDSQKTPAVNEESTPAKIAGPILLIVGALLLLIGLIYAFATSQVRYLLHKKFYD